MAEAQKRDGEAPFMSKSAFHASTRTPAIVSLKFYLNVYFTRKPHGLFEGLNYSYLFLHHWD